VSKPDSTPTRMTPVRVALIYVIASGLWVIASSELVFFELETPDAITRWEVGKGVAFILASGLLIYWITKLLLGWLEESEESRRKAEAETKLLEDQLLKSQRLEGLGRLAREIAHDFNNVIGVIVPSAHLLQRESLTPSGESRLASIMHASERAAVLTRQLLAFSRGREPEFKPVDLNATVRHTGALLERLLGREISLQLNLETDLWKVIADADQMAQVLMNLCLNARDAMRDGGTLEIQTENVLAGDRVGDGIPERAHGPHVLLTVKDSGSGMTPSVRKQIFEPFFTTKTPETGTGLGLSIVSRVVEQSGGFVVVDSEPGKGTAFNVFIPRAEETPQIPFQSVENPRFNAQPADSSAR
jgi:two-component system, cell cycle sensor histidine kinase and response regulator CckA